jgi:integrase
MKGCRPLTEKEIEKVIESFKGRYALRDKALFILGVKTGYRISEILSIRLGDVYQNGKIVDRVTVHRRNMKKKTEGRTVILNPMVKASLRHWIKELKTWPDTDENTFIFQSQKGKNKPISRIQVWRLLESAYKVCKLHGNLGTHSMRKSFANIIYEKLEKDLIRTQKALGHKNVNSTVSYLSFRQEDIDEAIMSI